MSCLEEMEDKRYLEIVMASSPFGKMGSGAPLRDDKGYLLAERGNLGSTHEKDEESDQEDKEQLPAESYHSLIIDPR